MNQMNQMNQMNRSHKRKIQEEKATNCRPAFIDPSTNTHLSAYSLTPPPPLSRIAFSSCIKPEDQKSSALWKHVRSQFRPDLWMWLGDNAYSDGTDMNYKRRKYNEVREDKYYEKYGPVAIPKIPVMGAWDDHDYGENNIGADYDCKYESQLEWCIHFNIPLDDPRCVQRDISKISQRGVYGSIIFPLPPSIFDEKIDTAPHHHSRSKDDDDDHSSSKRGGIHVINLDTRTDRHWVNIRKGSSKCKRKGGGGDDTDILRDRQWNWFEEELMTKPSEIKIITSGIQVLTPTNMRKDLNYYCAYDEGGESSFLRAIESVGENTTSYRLGDGDDSMETWGDVPLARARLLHMAQRAMNKGVTRQVIFLSGNSHMGDLLVKKMPPSLIGGGDRRMLYEVVASGVGRYRDHPYKNGNRVRLRSCDNRGDGNYLKECAFPFVWRGKVYDDCTDDNYEEKTHKREDGRPWCYFKTKNDDQYKPKMWGYCLPEEQELVKRMDQVVTKRTCGKNYHQVCGMTNIYGGVNVDWREGIITLSVFTPGEKDIKDGVASSINISFVPEWKKRLLSPSGENDKKYGINYTKSNQIFSTYDKMNSKASNEKQSKIEFNKSMGSKNMVIHEGRKIYLALPITVFIISFSIAIMWVWYKKRNRTGMWTAITT